MRQRGPGGLKRNIQHSQVLLRAGAGVADARLVGAARGLRHGQDLALLGAADKGHLEGPLGPRVALGTIRELHDQGGLGVPTRESAKFDVVLLCRVEEADPVGVLTGALLRISAHQRKPPPGLAQVELQPALQVSLSSFGLPQGRIGTRQFRLCSFQLLCRLGLLGHRRRSSRCNSTPRLRCGRLPTAWLLGFLVQGPLGVFRHLRLLLRAGRRAASSHLFLGRAALGALWPRRGLRRLLLGPCSLRRPWLAGRGRHLLRGLALGLGCLPLLLLPRLRSLLAGLGGLLRSF
mmetsp:Transcript_42493/g.134988  ORF Transcript_42493/g.134988 Transcript_42493/m.134988 type:complete len:291 (+) Transcript_42493:87-959(+)